MSGDDSGKDFWSRRKAAVREAEAEDEARKVADAEALERAGLEAKSDAEILEELGLPDPDTLTGEDDFSAFLAKTVPERLRRRAVARAKPYEQYQHQYQGHRALTSVEMFPVGAGA